MQLQGLGEHSLIVMDDMANEVYKSDKMAFLFKNVSEHEKISCIVVTQNNYPIEKNRRGNSNLKILTNKA